MLVPLAPDMSNIPQFIDSLFTADVRNYGAVYDAIQDGQLDFSFADGTSRGLILASWLAAWQQSQGDPYDETSYDTSRANDRQLLGWLASYIAKNGLRLCSPALSYVRIQSGSLAAYQATSPAQQWDSSPFVVNGVWQYGAFDNQGNIVEVAGQQSVVTEFLWKLYHGGHIVAVSAASDLHGSEATNFRSAFNSQFSTLGLIRRDPGNSHYTRTVNLSGLYFLSTTSSVLPPSHPLILSFVAGSTADFETNTFLQLEGWQAISSRHDADYSASKSYLWNFSTFGATVNSEKRSTTLFLADDSFGLGIDRGTHMPLYVGAGSLQPWMNPGLLIV